MEGIRTPFARMGKELSEFHPADLAFQNLRELVFRSNISKEEIDEVIVGNVANLPDAANIARVAALRAGFFRVSAMTVHRNCASSLESLVTGMAKIQSGMARGVIAGGVESMSQTPFLFSTEFQEFVVHLHRSSSLKKIKALLSFRLKMLKPRSALREALTDSFTGLNMGQTAEVLAKEFHITRKAQDDFAMESHRRAQVARSKLKEELFPLCAGPEYKMVEEDTGPGLVLDREKMEGFQPCFDRKYGTVTAGNSCSMNDGSSLLILMEEKRAEELDLKPLARIRSAAFCGLEPKRMGLGPVYAMPLALSRAGLTLKDMDLIEINEAFAAQVLACLKALASHRFAQDKLGLSQAVGEVNPDLLNVNGGAIAIGHPASATGSRLVLTLSKEMKRRRVQFGLVALCIGGGQGGAMVLENIS